MRTRVKSPFISGTRMGSGIETLLGTRSNRLVNGLVAGLDLPVTCTRSSSAFHPLTGQTLASNQPRLVQAMVLGAQIPWYLAENPSTNLLKYSNDFTNAVWTKTDCTLASAADDAWGGSSSFQITEGSTGTASIANDVTITANTTQTFSIYLRAGNHNILRIELLDTTGTDGFRGFFNLATGTWLSTAARGAGTYTTRSIERTDIGYRVQLTGKINASATIARCLLCSAAADGSTTRVTGATYFIDRAQCEAQLWGSSYIDTSSATVTRAGEFLFFVPPGQTGDQETCSPLWPYGWTSPNGLGTAQPLGTNASGGLSTRIAPSSSIMRADLTDTGGAKFINASSQVATAQTAVVLGASFDNSTLRLWKNGTSIGTSNPVNAPVNAINASGYQMGGVNNTNTLNLNGFTAAICFGRVLSSSERSTLHSALLTAMRGIKGVL